MEFIKRDAVINDLTQRLGNLMDEYQLDEIGIYEEEGPKNEYYLGFTVRKNGHVYMINNPYVKNNKGEVSLTDYRWTIQGEKEETKGFDSLNEVFSQINKIH